ncbi:unnamed protein product, partial [Allacma fusca]
VARSSNVANNDEVVLEVLSQAGHTFQVSNDHGFESTVATDVQKLILEKTEALMRKIDLLDFHVQALIPVQQINVEDLQNIPHIPVTTVEELQKCERFCRQSAVNSKKLAVVLARVGGRSVKEATENVLAELMTDEVAKEYNWAGTKRGPLPKMGIKNTGIVAMIQDSLKNMRQHGRVERAEIEEPIKNWLKNASSRIKRSNKPSESVDNESLVP